MFEAPTWANWLVAMQIYITNDNVVDPDDPSAPTTESFGLRVWQPEAEVRQYAPGEPVGDGFSSGDSYPEDALLEIRSLNPVDISDAGLFPDRVFFVGLEWLTDSNPIVAADMDEPIDNKSWTSATGAWEPVLDKDLVIRVVVSDTVNTIVRQTSWGTIESVYR